MTHGVRDIISHIQNSKIMQKIMVTKVEKYFQLFI